ncbi:TPA: hypothetical protein TXL60_000723 [Streptococcus suis]|nr:hypothetical protein [Streptococcus suis]HEL1633387.1 hypothetical protein [Streptococcus suis]
MLGEYSIMDLVTLGTIVANVAVILGIIVQLYRDNKALLRELEMLSKEHDGLSKEHDRLSKEHDGLSKEHQMIKNDTTYIADEMKLEKMARENLYKNTSRAKEILDTMDMMKEVVLQNAQLNSEISVLKSNNQELIQTQNDNSMDKLFVVIQNIDRKLSGLEQYHESEEIRSILKRIESELSENNQ